MALTEPTPGQANAAPAVGPVVITEILYHPRSRFEISNLEAEYVELRNISTGPVTLYDAVQGIPWRFTAEESGIELLFPFDPPVTLAAGEYLVLAKDAGSRSSRGMPCRQT